MARSDGVFSRLFCETAVLPIIVLRFFKRLFSCGSGGFFPDIRPHNLTKENKVRIFKYFYKKSLPQTFKAFQIRIYVNNYALIKRKQNFPYI
jgi:hypothetical protein